jgi:hypothetical protein
VGNVYTKRLAHASGGSQTQLFTVPAGRVWVVKDIVFAFTGPVGAIGVILVEPGQLYLAYAKAVASPELDYRQMTQALTEGEQLLVQIVDPNSATTIVVTGYDFQDGA